VFFVASEGRKQRAKRGLLNVMHKGVFVSQARPYPVVLFQLAPAGFPIGKLLGEINLVHLVSSFVGTKIAPGCDKLPLKV